MKNDQEVYAFKETLRILGISRPTLYLWLKEFDGLIPGAVQDGKHGWHFSRLSLDILIKIKGYLRNDNWTYQEVKSELDRISRSLTMSQEVRKSDHLSNVQPESNALVKYQQDMLEHLTMKLTQAQENYSIIMKEFEDARNDIQSLKGKLSGMETLHRQATDELKQGQEVLRQEVSALHKTIKIMSAPWYIKLWNWMNQPVSWRGKDLEVQMEFSSESKKDKPRAGMVRISDAQAA